MSVYNTQLLCTFTKLSSYENEIRELAKYYKIIDNKVYVLQNTLLNEEIFLTYNVEKNSSAFYPNTISVHRKKEHNIIYSINALNELIKMENNGVVSSSHQIEWSNYRNSFISTRDAKVKITPTKLLKIFAI